jgi:hypothetical protein
VKEGERACFPAGRVLLCGRAFAALFSGSIFFVPGGSSWRENMSSDVAECHVLDEKTTRIIGAVRIDLNFE